ncbi:MAG: dihydrolipoyl dehydrogenase [Thermoleophilia bacterium]
MGAPAQSETYDLAVIGAGPGGYVAALRAAQLGMKVAVVEKAELGGVCLNRGCIPTKAMLEAAAFVHEMKRAADDGLIAESGAVTVNYSALLKRRDKAVQRLTRGVAGLLKHGDVDVHHGAATFVGPSTLKVQPTEGNGGEYPLEAVSVIVATGSLPARLPLPGADAQRVIDSDGALALKEVPERLIVVGGGAVGCEWSTIFSRLGTKVTLIEMLPTLLPRTEPELGRLLEKTLTAEGVDVRTGMTLDGFEEREAAIAAVPAGEDETLEADYVLSAAGRRPNTEGLGLEQAGVKTNQGGWIEVDPHCRTNVASIYAIGDVTGGALLAHVASRQGVIVAETLGGLAPEPVRPERIPAVTFTDPEIATVGLTEEEAKASGLEIEIGRFPFSASGKAVATGHDTGLVKMVADRQFGRLLGVHIAGPHAGELLAEAVLALELEATLDELSSVIRSHPTLSEAVGEAAMAAQGHALHSV